MNRSFFFSLGLLLTLLIAIGCTPLPVSQITEKFDTVQHNLILPETTPVPLYPGAAVRFESLSVDDGLSQSVVHSIVQDQQGFLWFGTQDGLNRYDGYSFTIFKPKLDDASSVSDRWITVLYKDTNGILWIGTRNGGVNRFDYVNGIFVRYQNNPDNAASMNSDWVNAITQDASGALWVGTPVGLNRLEDDGSFTRYLINPDRSESLNDNNVLAILADPSGKLWLGTPTGLVCFDPRDGSSVRYQHDPKKQDTLSNDHVNAIIFDGQGNLWIGTKEGLNLFDTKTGNVRRYLIDAEDSFSSISTSYIYSLLIDKNGILWLGGEFGLERFDPATDRFQHYTANPLVDASLSNSSIRALYQDRGGLLWIGTWGGGVNQYNPRQNQFAFYRHDPEQPQSLMGDGVFSIFSDQDGIFWIGTYDGGLNRLDLQTGLVTHYLHDSENPDSLSSNIVWDIFRDSAGRMWICTTQGLDRFNEQNGKFIHHISDADDPNSINSDSVFTIYEDKNHHLWVGTGRGLERFDPGSKKFTRIENLLPNLTSVSSIQSDADNNLWVGTFRDGLYRIDAKIQTVESYTFEKDRSGSLSSNSVLGIHLDSKQRLWIATAGGGLNLYEPASNSFRAYTEREGLPNDVVYSIVEQPSGHLWLSTNFGLSRFDPENASFRNYTVRDGLQSNEFNMGAAAISSDGLISFGGISGVNIFDPEVLADNSYQPPLILTSLSKAGESFLPGAMPQNLTLNWPNTFFDFEFVALTFSQPGATQYAYRLENFDQDWNQLGNKHDGRYTNLPAGTYTLSLKAANEDGVWGQVYSPVTVTVIPPFWQTGWFIGLAFVFLLVSIYSGYRLRIRNIESHRRELETQVQERTREIEKLFEQTKELAIIEERNRLARELHDSAKQKAFAALAQLGTANGLIKHDTQAARSHLVEAENLVYDVIQELTFLIQEMYPLALQEKGLVITLREYVFEWENRNDIRASLHVEGERRLPLKVEQAIYRITQEALANVARHSRASQVKITLLFVPDTVALTIADNGSGFDPEQKPKGVGLCSIKERAESVGGNIRIESAPGKGTRIEVVVQHQK